MQEQSSFTGHWADEVRLGLAGPAGDSTPLIVDKHSFSIPDNCVYRDGWPGTEAE